MTSLALRLFTWILLGSAQHVLLLSSIIPQTRVTWNHLSRGVRDAGQCSESRPYPIQTFDMESRSLMEQSTGFIFCRCLLSVFKWEKPPKQAIVHQCLLTDVLRASRGTKSIWLVYPYLLIEPMRVLWVYLIGFQGGLTRLKGSLVCINMTICNRT